MVTFVRQVAMEARGFSVLGLDRDDEQVVFHTPGAVFTGHAEPTLGSM